MPTLYLILFIFLILIIVFVFYYEHTRITKLKTFLLEKQKKNKDKTKLMLTQIEDKNKTVSNNVTTNLNRFKRSLEENLIPDIDSYITKDEMTIINQEYKNRFDALENKITQLIENNNHDDITRSAHLDCIDAELKNLSETIDNVNNSLIKMSSDIYNFNLKLSESTL